MTSRSVSRTHISPNFVMPNVWLQALKAMKLSNEGSFILMDDAVGVYDVHKSLAEARERCFVPHHCVDQGRSDVFGNRSQVMDARGQCVELVEFGDCLQLSGALQCKGLTLGKLQDGVDFLIVKMSVGSRSSHQNGKRRSDVPKVVVLNGLEACRTFVIRGNPELNTAHVSQESCWIDGLTVRCNKEAYSVDTEAPGCFALMAVSADPSAPVILNNFANCDAPPRLRTSRIHIVNCTVKWRDRLFGRLVPKIGKSRSNFSVRRRSERGLFTQGDLDFKRVGPLGRRLDNRIHNYLWRRILKVRRSSEQQSKNAQFYLPSVAFEGSRLGVDSVNDFVTLMRKDAA